MRTKCRIFKYYPSIILNKIASSVFVFALKKITSLTFSNLLEVRLFMKQDMLSIKKTLFSLNIF